MTGANYQPMTQVPESPSTVVAVRPIEEGFSHLAARHPTHESIDRLAWAIRAARSWLGPEVEPAPSGMRRFQADMRLRVSDRPSIVTFRKAAFVDIGEPKRVNDGWEAEIAWRASTLAPLFPVFAGTLVARPGELAVSGWYAPPGGGVGRAIDRAVLHVAATRTGLWLLQELDSAAARGGV
jgi:hypothetical protein